LQHSGFYGTILKVLVQHWQSPLFSKLLFYTVAKRENKLKRMMKIKKVLPYASPEEAQQAGEHIQAVIIVPFLGDKIVLCRNRWRGWEFPGGGVEWGESVYSAAGRELVEETGAEFTSLEFVQVLWLERNIYRSLKIALFYAEVIHLNSHHDFYEIMEVKLFQDLPSPRLLSYECEGEIYQIALDAYRKAA